MSDVVARLDRARVGRQLVRIRRRIKGADRLDGYVLSVGKKWLLMTTLDGGMYLDGFCALRLRHVVNVKERKSSDTFARRILKLHGEWPPASPNGAIALASGRSLIESAAKLFPLVILLTEEKYPDECYIGAPVGWAQHSVRLHEVTPQAEWEDRSHKYKLADITRVDFGGRYEAALDEIAGSPPSLPPGS